MDVLVVGSANADLVVRVERWPGAGETVLGSDLAVFPGGKGANQAVAAARLGGRVGFIGAVGDDAHGELLRSALAEAAVDVAGMVMSGGPTGVALITVGPGGENSIVVSPGANGRLAPGDVDRDVLGAAAVLALQLEIPLGTVVDVARAAAGLGVRVVLNLAPAREVPGELLQLCDPLVVNEREAEFLAGNGGAPEELAAAVLGLGARSVVVTLGAAGALVAGGREITAVPAPTVEVVDTTGAGDAFTGALCLRLARGEGLVAAASFAARVGAMAVCGEGAQSSYPTLDAVSS
jgi:ribokinase